MLEVNAIYFILLVEGFVLLLVLLLAWLLVALVRRRRKRANIEKLTASIKGRSSLRKQQTESFLQAVYQLEGDDLRATLSDIDKHETEFFKHLIESLHRGKGTQISTLDTALDNLIKAYKCLQPRVETATEDEAVVEEISTLRGENEELRTELSVANNQLSDLITEFGEIFGGGKDHQLSLQEVMDRVDAIKADHADSMALKVQK